MTLLEYLNRNDRFASGSGMLLTCITPGVGVAEMTVAEKHLNGAGVCQGGALFTLADLAVAAAMNSGGCVTVGIENVITYHHSASEGQHLTATANLGFDHRRIPSCNVRIVNDEGMLIASGTALGYRKEGSFDFDGLM